MTRNPFPKWLKIFGYAVLPAISTAWFLWQANASRIGLQKSDALWALLVWLSVCLGTYLGSRISAKMAQNQTSL
jgi:uncharacterized membrane protein YfcA